MNDELIKIALGKVVEIRQYIDELPVLEDEVDELVNPIQTRIEALEQLLEGGI